MSAPHPRILVIRRRYLGDLVLLGIFLRSLRTHWSNASIQVLLEEQYAAVLTLNPDVDRTHALPEKAWSPGRWFSLARDLRREKFTHVFDFDNTEKTAVLARLTGAPFRAALNLTGRNLRLPWCYTHCETVEREFRHTHHITAYYNRFLQAVNVPVQDVPLRLYPQEQDKAWSRALPALTRLPAGLPRLLVHPGSRSTFRIWPAENFAAVCDQLQHEGLASVTLIGGPAEQSVVEAIRAAMQTSPAVIEQKVNVTQLAALFQCFDLFLCHDSGPMHLATAVGLPVVALFGSQNINEWRPLGANNITLQPPLPCASCVAPGVCKPDDAYHNYCVRNITIDRVRAAIQCQLTTVG
jgi:ADP-heptose:LPS heptosyltransferase